MNSKQSQDGWNGVSYRKGGRRKKVVPPCGAMLLYDI